MTITLAAVYTPIALQGGLTGSLFREFAFTLAGAVVISGVVALTLSPMMGSRLLRAGDTEKGFAGWINHRFDVVRELVHAHARAARSSTARSCSSLWALVVLLIFPFYMFSQQRARAGRGPGRGLRHRPGRAQRDARPDRRCTPTRSTRSTRSMPETTNTFQIMFPSGGFGGMVTKPWSERKQSTSRAAGRGARQGCRRSPGIARHLARAAGAAGRRQLPGRPRDRVDRRPEQLVEFANQLVGKAFAERPVHVRRHRREVRPAAGRGRVRPRQGARAGRRHGAGRPRPLDAAVGGNYVNRFSIQGRSYKVIPQVKRAERLTPDQLADIKVTGANGKLVPLSTFATLKTTTEPRELKRFQQLNAVRDPGRDPAGRAARRGARLPRDRGEEDPAAGLHARLRRRVAPAAHRGRQASSRSSCCRRSSSTWCSRRSSRASAIRSSSSRARRRWRSAGALFFSFLGFTSLNIYSQVGLITLVGLVSKNGILIVQFANHLQEIGPRQARRGDRGRRRRACARSS